mmetsp:Transcript_21298/g.52774  ORF Transcript_21298/g.52774 Transcript_21298/m.52774 type:complete len:257 (+) Transcript_21298:4211-4981(+)
MPQKILFAFEFFHLRLLDLKPLILELLQLASLLVQSLKLVLLFHVALVVFFLPRQVFFLQLVLQTCHLLFQNFGLRLCGLGVLECPLFANGGILQSLLLFRNLLSILITLFIQGLNTLVLGLEQLPLLIETLLARAQIGLEFLDQNIQLTLGLFRKDETAAVVAVGAQAIIGKFGSVLVNAVVHGDGGRTGVGVVADPTRAGAKVDIGQQRGIVCIVYIVYIVVVSAAAAKFLDFLFFRCFQLLLWRWRRRLFLRI